MKSILEINFSNFIKFTKVNNKQFLTSNKKSNFAWNFFVEAKS